MKHNIFWNILVPTVLFIAMVSLGLSILIAILNGVPERNLLFPIFVMIGVGLTFKSLFFWSQGN